MPIDAPSVSYAQLTRDLLAIAKFLFSKYRVHMFCNGKTNGRTDERRHIMSSSCVAWRRHKKFDTVQNE